MKLKIVKNKILISRFFSNFTITLEKSKSVGCDQILAFTYVTLTFAYVLALRNKNRCDRSEAHGKYCQESKYKFRIMGPIKTGHIKCDQIRARSASRRKKQLRNYTRN